MAPILKGKKVLLMGLGILGGGVATARFLVERGAELTVTDLKDAQYLSPSLLELQEFEGEIKYVLGEHREKDFLENEIIVINPDVSAKNKFIELAKESGKQIENELTLFYKFCPSRNIIAVTGTRGKTTTVNWTYHFLKLYSQNTVLAGNSSDNPFLRAINNCGEETRVVLEAPSYQLELLGEEDPAYAPKVAVITNIFQDHLNRHGSMEEYAKTKSNIFKSQTETDFLILNKNNDWTDFIISLNPKSKILFFDNQNLDEWGIDTKSFADTRGEHNLSNLKASSLAASLLGVDKETINKALSTLPQIKFRQQKIHDDGKVCIYNDTAATSPDATIAAIKRFEDSPNLILISGGTDRELKFGIWAEVVNKIVKPGNLILLGGSATEKMKKELGWAEFQEHEDLKDCFKEALEKASNFQGLTTILFSPSSKSFEKFKNEFDRGEKFGIIVKEVLS